MTLSRHSSSLTSCAFSPDARSVLAGSRDSTAILWDSVTGVKEVTLRGHTDRVCRKTGSGRGWPWGFSGRFGSRGFGHKVVLAVIFGRGFSRLTSVTSVTPISIYNTDSCWDVTPSLLLLFQQGILWPLVFSGPILDVPGAR